jgi:hypothetical protein
MAMMTAKEAWKWMADQWQASADKYAEYKLFTFLASMPDGSSCHSICPTISWLASSKRIDDDTADALLTRIRFDIEKARSEAGCRSCAYLFPCNFEGAKQRVAYCLKQYENTGEFE